MYSALLIMLLLVFLRVCLLVARVRVFILLRI